MSSRPGENDPGVSCYDYLAVAILARLVEGVNAADIGVLLALVWLVVRLEWTRSEHAAAHGALAANIEGVRRELTENIEGVRRELTENIEGIRRELTENIEGIRRELTGNIEGVRRELTGNMDGVKQEINGLKQEFNDVKQDVKRLLTGDVAWMQAVLQDRQRNG